jgi:NAD(P)-dependent dehydrogenase (short-subunit alcohol dehydrogenase family)
MKDIGMQRLQGRVAVVTGGGQGIGLGIVRRFLREGATLMLAQRNVEAGQHIAAELQKEFGTKIDFVATDVCRKDQVEHLIAATVERFGRLDILVNNAGGSFPKRLEEHTDEDMVQGLALNFWSAYWGMQAVFPQMRRQRWGRIINLGSLNGVNAHLHTAQYNVGKEALRALSRTAAVEWGQHGICVNVICPAAASPAYEKYVAENPEMIARILEQIPTRRMGDPEADIGGVAAFLASDDAAHVNGMTIHADGGSHVNGVSWRPDVT